jgi:hypothetical protein
VKLVAIPAGAGAASGLSCPCAAQVVDVGVLTTAANPATAHTTAAVAIRISRSPLAGLPRSQWWQPQASAGPDL